jgi:hypothetical protein
MNQSNAGSRSVTWREVFSIARAALIIFITCAVAMIVPRMVVAADTVQQGAASAPAGTTDPDSRS